MRWHKLVRILPWATALGVLLWLGSPWIAGCRRPGPSAERVEIRRVDGASWHETEPLFVAIVGVDIDREHPDQWTRADALHVLALDPTSGVAHIVNIPRDVLVDIPGYGRRKLNAAHELGGPELLVQCLRTVTGFPIQFYVRVGFQSLRRVVDSLGGVTVDIPRTIPYDLYVDRGFPAGSTHLDGDVALRFLRTRSTQHGGDFVRTTNQGRFLASLLGSVRQPSGLGGLARLGATFVNHVSTNLTLGELRRLVRVGRRTSTLENETAPGRTAHVDGHSVVLLDGGDFFHRIATAVDGAGQRRRDHDQ